MVNQVQMLEDLASSMTWGWVITLAVVALALVGVAVMTVLFFVYGQFSGYPKDRVVKFSVATLVLTAVSVTALIINHDFQSRTEGQINRTFAEAVESKYGVTVSISKTEMTGDTNEVTRDGVKTLVSVEPYGGEWVIKDPSGNLYPTQSDQ